MQNKNSVSSSRSSFSEQRPGGHRPVGFGAKKTKNAPESVAAPTPETNILKENPTKGKKSHIHLFKRRQKKERAKKAPRKQIQWGKVLLALIIAAIVIMITVLAILLINGNKTVHQMPVILRITEEPTLEPQELASISNTAVSISKSGALPSPDGMRA